MCHFTLIAYMCGHRALLTAPENTNLCRYAYSFNLQQGIDRAPASCFPLSDDVDDPSKITTKHRVFTDCESCRFESQYSTADYQALEALGTRIYELSQIAEDSVRMYQHRQDVQNKAKSLPHKWARNCLALSDVMNFHRLLLEKISRAREWLPYLQSCLDQDAPRKMFDCGLQFVGDMVEQVPVEKTIVAFLALLEHIDKGDWSAVVWHDEMLRMVDKLQKIVEDAQMEAYEDDSNGDESDEEGESTDDSNESRELTQDETGGMPADPFEDAIAGFGETSDLFAFPNGTSVPCTEAEVAELEQLGVYAVERAFKIPLICTSREAFRRFRRVRSPYVRAPEASASSLNETQDPAKEAGGIMLSEMF